MFKDSHRIWSIVYTIIIALILTLIGILGIQSYGIAVFILIPLWIGMGPILFYSRLTKNSVKNATAWNLAGLSLLFFTLALFCFGLEGIICIVMALPFCIPITIIGTIIGWKIVDKNRRNAPKAMVSLIVLIPLVAFFDSQIEPELHVVTTKIEIKAKPEVVWKNIIEFSPLDEPSEFLFKTGIAYPLNAKLVGKGVGAVRYCNFTTGSFIEPITTWDEGKLLAFNVQEQPATMKEISFYDINAPHLHDYFVSKRGQFKLTQLHNGNTEVEGSTWYYIRITPVFYWQLWSDYIVHNIHNRVLKHIKKNAEIGQ